MLYTSAGDFPLDEYCLKLCDQEWKILHVGAVLSQVEESHFLRELKDRLPYGVTLWASAIALAHEIASRTDDFRGAQVLELGAGTGLPGIVAASQGAQVIQTDRSELAISVAKRNILLNKVETLEQRLVDWIDWHDDKHYDWIIGSDILYAEELHPHLRKIFETNLVPNGKILLSDPFREASINLLESLDSEGWTVIMNKWSIGEAESKRPVGIFELSPP